MCGFISESSQGMEVGWEEGILQAGCYGTKSKSVDMRMGDKKDN